RHGLADAPDDLRDGEAEADGGVAHRGRRVDRADEQRLRGADAERQAEDGSGRDDETPEALVHGPLEFARPDAPGQAALRAVTRALRAGHERQTTRLNQASESPAARSTSSAAPAEKKAPISVFLVSITRREF